MSILIIDDSTEAQGLLRTFLKSGGHDDVLIAGSMTQASILLGKTLSQAGDATIDLILLDIALPDTHGVEGCRRLKANQALRDTPIIMVTGNKTDQILSESFAAGAVDYITKPFTRVALLARVGAALGLKRETDARKARERELIRSNHELQQALCEIHVLRGLIRICSFCKKIKNDQGTWQQIELYLREHSDVEFSHGVCAECGQTHYSGLLEDSAM